MEKRNNVKGFIPVSQIGHDKNTYLRYVNYNNITDMGFNGEETYICLVGYENYCRVKENLEEILQLIEANQSYNPIDNYQP